MGELGFITYSQLLEDAVLYHALRQVQSGFYIDVGAYDPSACSVTKAFYERGWRGINIEPVQSCYEKLLQERDQDINLNLAAGNDDKPLRFFEVLDSGLSTASIDFARKHERSGFALVERQVAQTTLNAICVEHSVSEIHFLKIDVEGFEQQVLEGIDLNTWRPWIILVEATEPLTTIENWKSWEPILLKSNFSFARFDGLNRFYFAQEHPELGPLLKDEDAVRHHYRIIS